MDIITLVKNITGLKDTAIFKTQDVSLTVQMLARFSLLVSSELFAVLHCLTQFFAAPHLPGVPVHSREARLLGRRRQASQGHSEPLQEQVQGDPLCVSGRIFPSSPKHAN